VYGIQRLGHVSVQRIGWKNSQAIKPTPHPGQITDVPADSRAGNGNAILVEIFGGHAGILGDLAGRKAANLKDLFVENQTNTSVQQSIATTTAILDHLRRLGWHITTHRVNETIELHAIRLDGSELPQVARCNDGEGPDEEYRAACLLAVACGIDVEDC
jgi:hypothetical protein